MWVADMDFKSPPEIKEALIKRASHNVYGYSMPLDSYYLSVIKWHKNRHNSNINKEWIVITPGIVFAINAIIQTFSQKNDAILVQKPVYYPFFNSIKTNQRKVINNPLKYKNNLYSIDFNDFEQKIYNNKVKLFILSNPHNPVGRVWTEEELTEIVRICKKYNVLIISDEIHQDIVYSGYKHIPLTNISDYKNIIICSSPSKTFNLAGLQISNIIIPDSKLREQLKNTLNKIGFHNPNLFGIIATETAYNNCSYWVDELIKYLENNRNYINSFFKNNFPKIELPPIEATFLAWLNFKKLNIPPDKIHSTLIEKGLLALDKGTWFGKKEGQYFERLNFACPNKNLKKALNTIKNIFSE